MKILSISPKSFAANTYVIISNSHAIVVDPSVSTQTIINAVSEQGAEIEKIILTHGHFDHITSIDTLRAKTNAPVMIHKCDAEMLTDGAKNAFLTIFGRDCAYSPANLLFEHGDEIALGDEVVKVIHTPGHSKGSSCFLCGDFMITGDTLFSDNIGRCDLWSGNGALMRSSLENLGALPQNLKIYPGHGAPSTLGSALHNAAYFI